MKQDILEIVEAFAQDANLSEHRVGMLLARNGRLLERLRNPRSRMWPETEAAILDAVRKERLARGLDVASSGPQGSDAA
nr:hypothetical protein [uncultured Celeribacter sp.]